MEQSSVPGGGTYRAAERATVAGTRDATPAAPRFVRLPRRRQGRHRRRRAARRRCSRIRRHRARGHGGTGEGTSVRHGERRRRPLRSTQPARAATCVLHRALGGGAPRSLRADNLGKTLGGALVRMEIDVPPDLADRRAPRPDVGMGAGAPARTPAKRRSGGLSAGGGPRTIRRADRRSRARTQKHAWAGAPPGGYDPPEPFVRGVVGEAGRPRPRTQRFGEALAPPAREASPALSTHRGEGIP